MNRKWPHGGQVKSLAKTATCVCDALDDGVVTTELALTILPGFRDRGTHDWLKSATTTSAITSTTWTMTAPFQAFIAEQCDQRLR